MNVFFRRIFSNKKWFFLNILGLTVSFVCLLLITAFTTNELTYDKFHSKSEQIYRLTQNTNTGKSSLIDARVWGRLGQVLTENIPQVKRIVRLSSFRNAMVNINDASFYSTKIYGVDSSFFDVFNFDLLAGNKKDAFTKPNQVFITESMALKYFGSTQVIGKTIEILHQKQEQFIVFTITGVLNDFPINSHIKADMLCTIDESLDSWAYTYLELEKNSDYERVQQLIQNNSDANNANKELKPLINLQPITDIHLHSHKSREMEQNGNINTLWLIIAGMVVILFIALINFANLNFVRFLSEQKSFMVKSVNGATKTLLAKEFLKEVVFLTLLSLVLGLFISYTLANAYNYVVFLQFPYYLVVGICFAYILKVLAFALVPFLRRQVNINLQLSAKYKNNSYRTFVIMQLALAVFAITSTLFLYKQIQHINQLHPAATSSNLLVLPNLPWSARNNIETFKSELLKNTHIIDFTAAMEEPAGIVTDNCAYELEGESGADGKTINILPIEDNFFSFFGIKPIAGTIDFGTLTTLEYERKALEKWRVSGNGGELSSELQNLKPLPGKYILNQMALKQMGIKNAEEAVGKRFNLNFLGDMFPEGEIIGVVEDFHYTNIYVKEKPLVMMQRKIFCHCLLIKMNEQHKSKALLAVKNTWEKLNPDCPFNYEFITDSYKKVYDKEYKQMKVLFLFACIAILLSSLGLYVMVSFSLKIKIKEIGVRRVNGASVSEILHQLVSSYLIWVFIALILAFPLVYFAINKWLQSFAYKTDLSWWIFALAGLIALIIALFTVSIQTYLTARKNPIEALRYE